MKNNKILKFLSTVLVAILIVTIAPVNDAVVSEMKSSANSVVKSIGEAVEKIDFDIVPKAEAKKDECKHYWSWQTATLTIVGYGEMPDYSKGAAPWHQYSNARTVVISSELTSIGTNAFNGFEQLETVIIEAPITVICNSAFSGCKSIKSIALPDTLQEISSYVFKDCIGLTELVIPDSVTAIYGSAFTGCYFEELTTPFVGGGPDNIASGNTNQLGYMFGSVENENTYAVKSRYDSNKRNYYVPYALKKVTVTQGLYKYGFENIIGLEEVIIADTVKSESIPACYFQGCTNLSKIEINTKKIVTIGMYAFSKCEALESLVLPERLKKIMTYSFKDCPNLANIQFPNRDFAVEHYSFMNTKFIDDNTDEFFIVGDGVLIDYKGNAENVQVPEGVKRIGDAFTDHTEIVSVSLPDSLLYLSEGSFYGCTSIENLVIPNSVQTIDAEAFSGLCNLKTLSIPFTGKSRDAKAETTEPLFGYAFGVDDKCPVCSNENCTTDTQTYIKRSGWHDYEYTYTYNFPKNLYTVTVTDSIIPRHAFRLSNVKRVVLGDGVTTLEPYAFFGSSLKEIVFNDVITSLPGSAFGECNSLKSVNLTSSIKSINGSFKNCAYLNTVNFVEGLESIGAQSFFGCERLKNFTLPDSLKTIGNDAFGNCKAIKEFYFGKGLQEISSTAFTDGHREYRSVEAFYVDEENPYLYSLDGVVYSYDGVLIAYPENKKASSFYVNKDVMIIYRDTLNQMDITKEFIVDPENPYLTSIDGVLYNKDVTTLIRCPREKTGEYLSPATVDDVDVLAFYGCRSLDKIEFVNNDIYFMEAAFQDVTVEELIVPNLSEDLQWYFENDKYPSSWYGEIGKLKITNQKSAIHAYFAKGISGLEQVEIDGPYSVILDYAFSGCNFEEFTIADNVGYIGDRAFHGSDIRRIYGGKNVKHIGIYCFASTNLELFALPETLEYIGDVAFSHTDITEVYLGNNVTFIGALAFGSCALEKAVISDNLADMADEIFKYCQSLKTIVIGGAVETIGVEAFGNCTALEAVIIPNSVTEISEDAFLEANEEVVIYCNEGSYAQEYATKNNIKYTTLVIDPIENQIYTGREIEPEVNASANNRRLTRDSEFTVSYKDNINVGTAKVIAKGLGDFKHLAATAQFAITPKPSENIRVISGSSSYRPKGVKPQLYVYSGATLLVEGKDFEIIENALLTDAGEYNIALSLMGNYYGIINITYEVSRRSIKRADIEYGDTVKITCEGVALEEGKDYIVTKETKENGDVVTTVEGIGNYKGTDTHTEVKSNNQNSLNWFQQLIDAIRSLFDKLFNIGF